MRRMPHAPGPTALGAQRRHAPQYFIDNEKLPIDIDGPRYEIR
jgi:hypothetical protein